MCVVRECVEEPFHFLLEQNVLGDRPLPIVELPWVGELAKQQQIGDFEETGVEGEVFDGVAAVAQDAFGAVDVGDLRSSASRVGETGIEGDVAGFGAQRGDLDARVADRGLDDRKFELVVTGRELSGPVGHTKHTSFRDPGRIGGEEAIVPGYVGARYGVVVFPNIMVFPAPWDFQENTPT